MEEPALPQNISSKIIFQVLLFQILEMMFEIAFIKLSHMYTMLDRVTNFRKLT